ncbi:hypothetical protein FHX42_000991 [Saccharopolyspora lacisalsi]|uniref:histidine kinase n=1 Tax=Halosaccharopolyspora lacisalsi TaxID=1000566 RepID=A0A839DNV8_9PSEU|nr:ATP-binding protein [Halosaccharopolyspora lacisalsi]MBA8823662.1 hypothetical protein [Halosaccharopolyspora lacisalsi]
MTRVRDMLERSRRSLLAGSARERLEGPTKQLLQRSRQSVAQFVAPTTPKQPSPQEVLAGVCSSVALRDLNLVDSLLEQLERMEADEDDPDSLASLYKLDHLATRLRRNGENLRVLAGRDAGENMDEASSLVDVIRAGMSSIEHYSRVELGKISNLGVVGVAADDVSRLLAELLDNATSHSPPTSAVTVSAHLTEQGSVMVRVEDSGIGLPAARLSALNERLASTPVLDRDAVRHMGLAVVRRLASRHDISVWLGRRAPHGTTASVLLPESLVHETSVPAKRQVQVSEKPEPARAQRSPDAASPQRPTTGPVTRARAAERTERTGQTGKTEKTGKTEQAEQAEQSSTTPNGLPRRVPQSLKGAADNGPAAVDNHDLTESEQRAGHEQLLADLGDFAEGEQAARQDTPPDDTTHRRAEQ